MSIHQREVHKLIFLKYNRKREEWTPEKLDERKKLYEELCKNAKGNLGNLIK